MLRFRLTLDTSVQPCFFSRHWLGVRSCFSNGQISFDIGRRGGRGARCIFRAVGLLADMRQFLLDVGELFFEIGQRGEHWTAFRALMRQLFPNIGFFDIVHVVFSISGGGGDVRGCGAYFVGGFLTSGSCSSTLDSFCSTVDNRGGGVCSCDRLFVIAQFVFRHWALLFDIGRGGGVGVCGACHSGGVWTLSILFRHWTAGRAELGLVVHFSGRGLWSCDVIFRHCAGLFDIGQFFPDIGQAVGELGGFGAFFVLGAFWSCDSIFRHWAICFRHWVDSCSIVGGGGQELWCVFRAGKRS